MYLTVATPQGTHDHPDHDSWVVGSEGELDLLHKTGITTTTYADGAWYRVNKVLEDGEVYVPIVGILPGEQSEASTPDDDDDEESDDEDDEHYWPPFR